VAFCNAITSAGKRQYRFIDRKSFIPVSAQVGAVKFTGWYQERARRQADGCLRAAACSPGNPHAPRPVASSNKGSSRQSFGTLLGMAARLPHFSLWDHVPRTAQ
jgi:hypothetical protein